MQQYELKEKIGHGGMGLVYRAIDLGLDREVAIKFMDPSLLHDKVCIERFLREARLIARLDHPNVVRIHGAGTWEDGRPYFVMELIQGVPLTNRIRKGALPETEAVDIANQALSALSEAHALGIVHRDIKSSNILLCPGGRVKLIDFGIARAEDAASVTSTGKVIGTPSYMSPEQAMGDPASAQSDLYSMGIVLYEMLAGKVPFKAETPVAILMMQANNTPPPLPGHVSIPLQSAISRSLEKKLELRFASANEMKRALELALVQDPTMHTTAGDSYSQTPVPPAATPPMAETPSVPSQSDVPASSTQPPAFQPPAPLTAEGASPTGSSSGAVPPQSYSTPPPVASATEPINSSASFSNPQPTPVAPPVQPPHPGLLQPSSYSAQPQAPNANETKTKNTTTCLVIVLVCIVISCIGTLGIFYLIGGDPSLLEPQGSSSFSSDPWSD